MKKHLFNHINIPEKNINLLNPTQVVGVNTQGSSLRNANLQIRSEPANPQVPVSIWMNSTISPDSNRRDFEVGCKSK